MLLCTVVDAAQPLDVAALLAHMGTRLAKWWLPDEVRVIETMPLTTTGKIDKVALRSLYGQARASA